MRRFSRPFSIFQRALTGFDKHFLPGCFFPASVNFTTTQFKNALIDVKAPGFPESITEGDIRWLKQTGDHVKADETIAEVETDKTSIPVFATESGVIHKFYCPDGSKIKSKQVLCVVDTDGNSEVKAEKTDPAPDSKGSHEYVMAPKFPESISEGDVRWRIKLGDVIEADCLLGEIETDKTSFEIRSPFFGVVTSIEVPDGGKVKMGDKLIQIEKKQASKPSVNYEKKPVVEAPKKEQITQMKKVESTPLTVQGDRTDTRVKMTRMRQTVAHRLKNAQNTLAMLTTFNEADMSNLIEMRKKHQEEFVKKNGIKLGFMSTFVAAACHALRTVPAVNAYIDGEDIVYHNYTDISVAVATPKGLVVPVIRDADKLSFADVEKTLISLAEKGRNNKLTVEDMEGGTFTITNGGVFGSLLSTPIINPPHSAILGLHAINERPMAVAGNVVIRPMMYVALTYDHRLVDGREAVTFLKVIKQCVEDPHRLLLGL